ncbi:MAG: NTP transferase domain-containing protein [Desulfobulbaceae bacterium]|nr:NTP transferase domain-containing protein [Desulfobulbaceae bacterium]
MESLQVSAIILAAGKGTRMKSSLAKVLHTVFYRPMLFHVLDAVNKLDISQTVVVTGHQYEAVEEACTGFDVDFARQTEQLGTGHAVLCARSHLHGEAEVVLILCGDTPLIQTSTLQEMLADHLAGDHGLTVMTTVLDNPTNYGRIVTAENGFVQSIVEEKDSTDEQKKIKEINAGIYCVDKGFLFNALENVGTDNKQGEVYLTDIVSIAHSSGLQVNKYVCDNADEVLGVNSRIEMAQAHSCLQSRVHSQLMASGVSLLQPATISVQDSVSIGRDTVIEPNVHLCGQTKIGEGCRIFPFSYLDDCQVGDNVFIGAGSFLNGASISDDVHIPPHTVINNKE